MSLRAGTSTFSDTDERNCWLIAEPAAAPRSRRTRTACVAPKSAGRALRSAGRGKRMIFAQMAGLLAMPTLLPEGVLSAEGEDAQAVNSS